MPLYHVILVTKKYTKVRKRRIFESKHLCSVYAPNVDILISYPIWRMLRLKAKLEMGEEGPFKILIKRKGRGGKYVIVAEGLLYNSFEPQAVHYDADSRKLPFEELEERMERLRKHPYRRFSKIKKKMMENVELYQTLYSDMGV